MTGVQEYKEDTVETPKERGPGPSPTFRVLAILIAAIATIGLVWLVFGDSGGETPTEDSVVSATDESTDQAPDFPFGRFENADSGIRILVLDEGGTYTFTTPQGLAIRGTYEFDDGLLTFDPRTDPGTYSWEYEDNILKFNVIEDGNRNRYAFVTYPFTLTP